MADRQIDPNVLARENASTLTTFARSLGGAAALGLLAAVAEPEIIVVALAAIVGSLGGFFAGKLDRVG